MKLKDYIKRYRRAEQFRIYNTSKSAEELILNVDTLEIEDINDDGIFGELTFPNGSVYKGQLKNGKAEGIGKLSYANGKEYNGQWKNGKAHGYGKLMNGGDL